MTPVLVSGGAGFIGSALVRRLVALGDYDVTNVDKLTYAASPAALDIVHGSSSYRHEKLDICDGAALREVFARETPRIVFHLAAESHVDRSIDRPDEFVQTNIVGTVSLLNVAQAYWMELPEDDKARFRFVHVSTDEVYGSLNDDGFFTEQSPYRPNSPYAASKASADMMVRAWHKTYGLPAIISNCSNNFGPFQFPEKLIPVVIRSALDGAPIPVYGDGQNVRDWIYVDDHVDGLLALHADGAPGQTYNFGGGAEHTNLQLVTAICDLLDGIRPNSSGRPYKEQITFVTDRPGHDFRYAIDNTKASRDLNWMPRHSFEDALLQTVRWYVENEAWWRALEFAGRQGLSGPNSPR